MFYQKLLFLGVDDRNKGERIERENVSLPHRAWFPPNILGELHACMHAKSLQSRPTLRPYGQQPTRLLCPQDSLGKNTGVGCHFLLLGELQGLTKKSLLDF